MNKNFILYNVQVSVDEAAHDEWLEWMTSKHIPDVMKTGCFESGRIYRVVAPEPEDGDGVTFNVQYYADSIENYERYQIEHAALLQAEHNEKFKGKFTSFRTVMEEI